MYIRMIPNKIVRNNIISIQKRKIIKFQNTNDPGPDTSYGVVFFCSVF